MKRLSKEQLIIRWVQMEPDKSFDKFLREFDEWLVVSPRFALGKLLNSLEYGDINAAGFTLSKSLTGWEYKRSELKFYYAYKNPYGEMKHSLRALGVEEKFRQELFSAVEFGLPHLTVAIDNSLRVASPEPPKGAYLVPQRT